jgi:MFS family permease
MVSRFLPPLLVSPVAGIIVDRFDRRRILILSDLLRALLALGFLLVDSPDQIWMVYAFGALLMAGSSFFNPARSATIPNITGPEEILAANALMGSTTAATLAFGSALGGFFTMGFGYKIAFVFNSLSFLASAALIRTLHVPARKAAEPSPEKKSFWGDFKAGMSFIRSNRLVQGILFLSMGWATGGGAAQVLFGVFAVNIFHAGDQGIGLFYAAAGLGVVLGASIANRFFRGLPLSVAKWVMGVSFVVHGLFYSLFSLMPSFGLAALMMLLSRLTAGITMVLGSTFLMQRVPDKVRGRTLSANDTLTMFTMISSIGLAGMASNYLDARAIGFIAGVLPAVAGLLWLLASFTGYLESR